MFHQFPFLVPIFAYFVTHSIKFIFESFSAKKLIWKAWISNGGMPSGHSAFVSSICFYVFLSKGISSIEFAISFVIAMIVMRDAFGLRNDVGEHAKFLNKTQKANEKFNERIGHTLFQVIVGGIIGVLVATISYVTF